MTPETTGNTASVFDFDDTLIGRELFTRSMGLVTGIVRPHAPLALNREEIARLEIEHGRVNEHISALGEYVSYKVHASRSVLPGVNDELAKLADSGVHIYGNTGRSNKADWVDMTEETLHRGHVRNLFREIFYTPDGTKTAVSKAHALHLLLSRYKEVEFTDDDPRTARYIASLFPTVRVNLIQYGSTGLLVAPKELALLPNLRRVAVFGSKKESHSW